MKRFKIGDKVILSNVKHIEGMTDVQEEYINNTAYVTKVSTDKDKTLWDYRLTFEEYGDLNVLDEEIEFAESNFQEFINLLNNVGCKFFKGNNEIEIDFEHILSHGGVTIEFDENGKFKGFMACE